MKRVLLPAGLLAALGVLAAGISSDWLVGLDTSVAEWFDAHRTRRREVEESGIFGYIGRPMHVLIAAVVCGALLSVRARSAIPALCVVGGVGVGVVVEGTMKALIGRDVTAGPLLHYPHSFPSGHVTGTAALLGMIAVFLGAGHSRAVRTALAVLVSAAVALVAYLALYTGAHTFTDVIGGMLLGGAIVASGAAVQAMTSREDGALSGSASPTSRATAAG